MIRDPLAAALAHVDFGLGWESAEYPNKAGKARSLSILADLQPPAPILTSQEAAGRALGEAMGRLLSRD